MIVELIGGPLDGEVRDVKNPNQPLRIAMRRPTHWQLASLIPNVVPPIAQAEYVPRPDRPGELHWAGARE